MGDGSTEEQDLVGFRESEGDLVSPAFRMNRVRRLEKGIEGGPSGADGAPRPLAGGRGGNEATLAPRELRLLGGGSAHFIIQASNLSRKLQLFLGPSKVLKGTRKFLIRLTLPKSTAVKHDPGTQGSPASSGTISKQPRGTRTGWRSR